MSSFGSRAHQEDGHLPPVDERTLLLICDSSPTFEPHVRALERIEYRQINTVPLQFSERVARSMQPDGIILFNTYPRPNATAILDTVRALRAVSTAPLLVVNQGESLALMVQCFESGADDVVAARVSALELDTRLRARFRRLDGHQQHESPPDEIRIGNITIDTRSRSVVKGDDVIELSPTEYRLLLVLAEQPGRILPTRTLMARVWGPEFQEETHYLRLYIRYLRQKLEDNPALPRYLVNRRGTGYALTDPGENPDAALDISTARSA